MNIIYPADYFNLNKIDEMFVAEADAFREAGFTVVPWNNKEVPSGQYLYRGWMLLDTEYDELVSFLAKHNASLITSKAQYLNAHHLPNWYESLKELTPETVVTSVNELDSTLDKINWSNFFVKDFVKSLTTSEGSIAESKDAVRHIIKELDQRKGIVGGICLRKVHEFDTESEIRYFCFNGKILTPNDIVPDIVNEVKGEIKLPFYSIDIIKDKSGKDWVVEIGDGQVSDLKSPWQADDFVTAIKNINKQKIKYKP